MGVAPSNLEELNQSTQVIVRFVQNECFPGDVKEVRQNKKKAVVLS